MEKTVLDKGLIWAQIISLIAIPIVIAYIGNNFNDSQKDKEIKSKYVELAIDILKNKPDEKNKNLRSWALDIVNKYSGVKMDTLTQADLRNKTAIPPSPVSGGFNLDSTEFGKLIKKSNDIYLPKKERMRVFLEMADYHIKNDDFFSAALALKALIKQTEYIDLKKQATFKLDSIQKVVYSTKNEK